MIITYKGKMKKKMYDSLTLKVVKLNAQAQLLAGSSVEHINGGGTGITGGGGGTGTGTSTPQAPVFRLPDF